MAVGLNFRTPAEPMSAYQRPSNAVPSNVRRVANLHKPSMFTVAMALLNQHDSGGLQVHRKLVGGRPTSASEPDRRASVWSADVTPANTGWEPSVYVGDCGLIHESRPLKGSFSRSSGSNLPADAGGCVRRLRVSCDYSMATASKSTFWGRSCRGEACCSQMVVL